MPTTRVEASPQEAVRQFQLLTLRKLDGVVCGVHGKAPVVEFHGMTLRDIRISMRCCCRELSTVANRAIVQPAVDPTALTAAAAVVR